MTDQMVYNNKPAPDCPVCGKPMSSRAAVNGRKQATCSDGTCLGSVRTYDAGPTMIKEGEVPEEHPAPEEESPPPEPTLWISCVEMFPMDSKDYFTPWKVVLHYSDPKSEDDRITESSEHEDLWRAGVHMISKINEENEKRSELRRDIKAQVAGE